MGLSVNPNKILFHEISREIQVLDQLSEQNNKKWSAWFIVPNLLHIYPNSRELIFVSSPRFYSHRDAQFLLFNLFLLICARTLLILIIGRYRPTIEHLLHRFNLYWHFFFTLNQHQLSIKLSILLLRDSFSVPHTHLENWKVWTGYLVIINRPLEWYWKRPVAFTNLYWMANLYKRDKFLFFCTQYLYSFHIYAFREININKTKEHLSLQQNCHLCVYYVDNCYQYNLGKGNNKYKVLVFEKYRPSIS